MICPNCNTPNPNGYMGLCRYCKYPLSLKPEPVVEKKQEKPKATSKKAKSKSKA
jgi:hypothetical protein